MIALKSAFQTTFLRRGLSTTTKPIPLSSSSLLQVSGADTRKFLQGLCTNDLTKLSESNNCMPAAFLTSKGRIFATSLLYYTSKDSDSVPSITIELHKSIASEFARYLTMYRLRSKVTIKPLPNQTVAFIPGTATADRSIDSTTIMTIKDPRAVDFGTRLLVSDENNASNDSTSAHYAAWYERYKLVHGVADGPEVHGRIPLECNLDLLHYISFAKGCYVGQELTARTKFKGLVRKRLVPFLLADSATTNATGNATAFESLPADLKERLLAFHYTPSVSAESNNSVLGVGSKVFADATSSKSIGEVVHLDSTGTLGVAMIQQAVVTSSSGNFAVRAPVPKVPGGADEAAAEAQAAEEAAATAASLSEPVAYISTYRPDWLQGLDEKTGNVVDM